MVVINHRGELLCAARVNRGTGGQNGDADGGNFSYGQCESFFLATGPGSIRCYNGEPISTGNKWSSGNGARG